MLSAILGAAGLATSIGSSIAGGIKARKADKAYKAQMRQAEKRENDWYERRYNEDYTQRADVQRLLTNASNEAQKQIKAAIGRNAVMGGTEESISAARDAANNGLAQTTANVAAQASAYKDSIDQQHREALNKQTEAWKNYYAQSAAGSQNAAGEGVKAGMGLVGVGAQMALNNSQNAFKNQFNTGTYAGHTQGIPTTQVQQQAIIPGLDPSQMKPLNL